MNKLRHSPSSFFLQFLLIAVFLSVHTLCSNYFKYSPETKFYLPSNPTAVRISSYSQNEVAVGMTSGSINVYSLTSYNLRYTLSGCHTSAIKDIKEIRGNGWVSLDASNNACKWNSTGYYTLKLSFNYNVIDMSVTFLTYGYAYIGFNFGDQVYEYYSETVTTTPRVIYNATSSARFVRIQYDGYGTRLFASMNNNNVYAYNCTNGQYLSSPAYTSYSVTSFNKVNNGDIVFTDGSYLYRMNSSMSYTRTYISNNLDTVVGSYKNSEFLYITMSTNSSSSLKVYDSTGYKKQELTYAYSYFRSIDASANYLVYADTYGYFGIATYSPDIPIVIDIKFPVWAIVLISVGLFLICVVGIVVFVVKARKRRLANAANGYNRFNDAQGTNAIIPSPQPYNPVNPQPYPAWNNQNQGWNQGQNWNNQNQAFNPQQNPGFNPQNQGWNQNQPNQGWNNQAPNVVPVEPVVVGQPPNQNPYQANQPSNWS